VQRENIFMEKGLSDGTINDPALRPVSQEPEPGDKLMV
jgi:hypothetical protein